MRKVTFFRNISFLLFTLFLINLNTFSQVKSPEDTLLSGQWLGTLKIGGQELRIVLNIKINELGNFKATLDSPDQGAKDIPIDSIILSDKNIRAESKMIGGMFEGKYNPDSMMIRGEWNQAGMKLPLSLKKTTENLEIKRPQEPKPPFPYKEVEVTIENKTDNLTLAGTLTLPSEKGSFPAVVLITGSGPQDRDEQLFGHKPFKVIADYLTRNGIAVLRMDDRGIGKSTGNFGSATTFDFVNDILSAVEFLKTRPEINKKQIGLIGHSEGGIIAPLVSVKSADVAYIVLLAGPGVPGDELISLQLEALLRANSLSEEAIQKNKLLMKTIFGVMQREADSAAADKKTTAIMKEFRDGLTDEEKNSPIYSEEGMKKQIAALSSKWFKTFLSYDPRPTLEKVKCPVLALNGGNDLQVSAKQNIPPIKEALTKGGNKNFEVMELPGLNHLFQHAATGNLSEYPKIEETFSPEALKIITEWLLKTTKQIK